ncbi:hypothetical protein O7635_06220 [Asanoa sp. WMMD1127]|uniref:hypothetical protein n=1 Tax=Asanoa sp. WMMD1127 TaxID=3016107 RepID=UPI0024180D0A|nr:hypothetical protein [Asanoa sp. WMMD1127]MDG4821450.1 hypothetical protein [Asanoa sp. WMMD1127]
MPEGVPSIELVAGQEDGPRDRWPAAFTPGNDVFSGHLPTLLDAPDALARAYYAAAWQALRGAAGPRAAALLDPVPTRARLLVDLARGAGDFRAVEAYVVLTGDADLLAEKAGGATVLDHLRAMADASAGPVSAEAIQVGRARSYAALLRRLGECADPVELAAADQARAVLARYAGDGRWQGAETPDESRSAFYAVAVEMPEFLDLRQRAGLVEYARRELTDEPPGALGYALCRLGRPDRALALLAGAARPGPAELEAILGGLFGIHARFSGPAARPTRPGLGRLVNT